ncbi:MAG: LpxL/LpxP family Kdo(2)-lipid IV(A) lauroyl/palmitoleoyl acyltransferase [Proteobacteria bacterium]|nr:LpxL/LpxP family Kdo(2)-lipid IV(A) lauroyl/palmitoleoyl acyltransferase [Pseudomonadota bacterium]
MATKPSLIKHLPAWLAYGLAWLFAQLPYGILLFLGRGLGKLFKWVAKSRQKVISKNISACFPELSGTDQLKLIDKNYAETGMMVTQTIKAFFGKTSRIIDDLEIEGAEHLQQCLDKKQGVLLVSAHFTALDFGGKVLCQRFPIAGVYRPHKNPVVEFVVNRARLKYAKKMFSRDQLKAIIRHLQSAGIIWYAPDQDYRRGSSIFSNFFGIKAATITATHQLARISKCKVMFYSVKRIDAKPYYQLKLSKPLENFPSKDPQIDTDRINLAIEQMVRQTPEQYLWLHKRFKNRPQGEAGFY